jgi:type I restriction enzyme, S subunit
MSFPRYPKYKPSDVEWLGDVPDDWEEKPLRSIFSFSKGLTITKEDLQDEGISCVNYGEIHSKYGFRLNPTIHQLRYVATEYLSSNPDALIRDGDFVFADTSEDLEGSGNFTHLRSDKPLFAGYHTIIGRPRKGVYPLFLAYQLHSPVLRSQIQSQVKGIKVFSISQAILKSIKCWLPSDEEQTLIASFLDRETSKIDSLVGEQRRLIELLKEKRQAVISHAVTKGLNPHAPLKPSGIEWLGDVPEHWEVRRLKHISPSMTVGIVVNPSTFVAEEGYPFIYGGDIREGVIDWKNARCIDAESSAANAKTQLRAGDLLTVRVGAPGVTAVVPVECESGNCASVMLIRQGEFNSYWLCYAMNTRIVRFQVEVVQYGAAQEQFNISHAVNFWAPTPPRIEQDEITDYLDDATTALDALTAEAERGIELLQERRTALISAAVTGKIDVRGLVKLES